MKNFTPIKVLQVFLALVFAIILTESFGQDRRSSFYDRHHRSSIMNNYSGAKTNWLISKPGSSMNYSYVSNGWQHETNTTYIYDSKGNLIEGLIKTPAGQNLSRYLMAYDSTGFLYQETIDMWRNNAWAAGFGFRYLEKYNAAGYITESIWKENLMQVVAPG